MLDAALPDRRSGRLPRAIVLGINGHPRCIAAIRSLTRAGIPLVGVKTPVVGQECYSRHMWRPHTVEAREEELLPFLESLGDEGGVLFPVYDSFIRLVSMHSESLSKRFILTVQPWEILRQVMEHEQLYGIARQAGVNTPTFVKPQDEAELRSVIASLDLANHEYLLKTVPAIGPAEVESGRATKVAGSDPAAILAACLEIHSRLGEYPMIAEVVPGEANECYAVTMVVDRNQTPRLTYCTQRIKLQLYSRGGFVHPYALGSNVYCESVRDEEAIEAAARLVKAIGYCGLITFEFRRDPRDQKLILIKADPRVVRATSLSTALGMDTPTALYRLSVDGKLDAPKSYPLGVGWLWEGALLESFWDNRDSQSMRQEIAGVARNFKRIKAFALFSLEDPLPFIMHTQWRTRDWIWDRIKGITRRCINAARRRWRPQPVRPALGGSRPGSP
jgi:predicted ATP-grasp superfamily ATP-dependent carboligase